MATFCLVQGSWHGGWCWEPLSALPKTPAALILARGDPAMAARDVLGVEALEIDCGHFPMLDRAPPLADLLEGVLEDAP